MKISGFVVAVVGVAVIAACSSSDAPGGGSTAGASNTDAGAMSEGGGGTAGSAAGAPSAGNSASGGPGAAGATPEGGSGGGAPTCMKCPTTCCDAGARCIDDGLGNLSCKKICVTSAECPASAQCCELQSDGSGVCGGGADGQLCRCTTGAECSSKACAPHTNAQGSPLGPYVCVPNDGGAYHGCNGLTTCDGTDCCFIDAKKNQFCAAPCTTDNMCFGSKCLTFPSKASTCAGMMGCGPQ